MKLVATIFPPVELFEEVADAADFDALVALRSRTDPLLNQRLRHALAIPPRERAYGPGAGYVMTPFVHPSPIGTRFRPPAFGADSYGVYYATRDETTAIAEVQHHRVGFLLESRAPAQDLDFELVKAAIKGSGFYDL
ncbi:MAG TPA: RES family NAD+ phosphorylase, partial [Gemmatimonadaceae bacterium]|nr:RES family NAD+ phosphorylase [Gemmatimonadaceae bacterium]